MSFITSEQLHAHLGKFGEGLAEIIGGSVMKVVARVKAVEDRLERIDGVQALRTPLFSSASPDASAPVEDRTLPADVSVGFHRSEPTKPHIRFRGPWRPGTEYRRDDGVTFADGSSWRCRAIVAQSCAPGGDPEVWERVG